MSQITTHVLDTSRGVPASDLAISLFHLKNDKWLELANGRTNEEGRISDLLSQDLILSPGSYKMNFETQAYFDTFGESSFYPNVEITFSIKDANHYHIPLLLSAYGYSTYRGS